MNDDKLTFFDRFWYKLVIGLVMLLVVVILDRYKVINMEVVKNELQQNINILKIANSINGELNIIDLGGEDSKKVSTTYLDYVTVDGKMHIETNNDTGVNNYLSGVVTKIIRENDKYEISILGLDDTLYTYSNLEAIDVHIYEYVKTDDIIGRASEYYVLTKE